MTEISDCLMRVHSEDAEDIMSGADALLRSEEAIEPAVWLDVLDALCRAGRCTWYRCGCGEISPASGCVDAFCERCGALRRLPPRLSRSPWPLYLAVLRRVCPEDWFERLAAWGGERHIGQVEREKGGAYPREAADSGAGGASYGLMAEDARGAVPPGRKMMRFHNDMLVFDDGEIRGLTWICAEMMDSQALAAICGSRD